MQAVAKLRKLHISSRKANLVATLVRGMNAGKALETLEFTYKRSAEPIAKLLKSAIANYKSQEGQGNIDEGDLYIKAIHVGSAGMLKRIKPAPRGTAHRIRKRMTHVTLVVEKESEKGKQASTKNKNSNTTK